MESFFKVTTDMIDRDKTMKNKRIKQIMRQNYQKLTILDNS